MKNILNLIPTILITSSFSIAITSSCSSNGAKITQDDFLDLYDKYYKNYNGSTTVYKYAKNNAGDVFYSEKMENVENFELKTDYDSQGHKFTAFTYKTIPVEVSTIATKDEMRDALELEEAETGAVHSFYKKENSIICIAKIDGTEKSEGIVEYNSSGLLVHRSIVRNGKTIWDLHLSYFN